MSEKEENGALCFWLGFFLSLFGVLIAAIIGKVKKELSERFKECYSMRLLWL